MAVVDDKTPRLGLLLPFTDNFLQDDVERLRDTFGLLDVLVVTRDKTTGKIADDMLSAVIAKLDAQGKLLTAQIPSSVVQKGPDGKIDASLMPSIAVGDNVYEYNYVKEDVMEAKVRVKLVLNGTPAARPYVYSLRVSVIENS